MKSDAPGSSPNLHPLPLSFNLSLPGEFGPFSRYIPVRQLNGIQYELLTYPEYERLKKKGLIKDKAFTVERPSVAPKATAKTEAQAAKVVSQLKGIVRPMYSNPQLHGARLVATVLGDTGLTSLWNQELTEMSDRINDMRAALVSALGAVKCPPPNGNFRDWKHITSQIGMFAFTGLNAKQVEVLTNKHHIYCTKNGRFSMAGINPGNVKYIAAAIKDAVTSCSRL